MFCAVGFKVADVHGAGGHARRAFGDQACGRGISKSEHKASRRCNFICNFLNWPAEKMTLDKFQKHEDVAGTCGGRAGTGVDEARVVGVKGDAGGLREARRQSLARQ